LCVVIDDLSTINPDPDPPRDASSTSDTAPPADTEPKPLRDKASRHAGAGSLPVSSCVQ